MIYLLLFSGSITVTKVIQGNSAIEGNVDNNEIITVSEFTITDTKTAKNIKIKKGEEEEKDVDLSDITISDIITAIKV